MRNFLKHNFLVILLLLCSYAAWTWASTITRPYSSVDYAGGQKAVGAKVNAEFQSIVDWLNGGNIGSTNIATGGVAASNLIDGIVSFAKMAASNIKITSSSSAFLTGIATATNAGVAVDNLSTTITSTGRPLHISLEAATSTYLVNNVQIYGSYVNATDSVASGALAGLFFVRDGSTTAHYQWVSAAAAQGEVRFPCSSFSYTEVLAAGTYVYSVKVSNNTPATTTVRVANCRLVVREEL